MAETYSLAAKGRLADSPYTFSGTTLGDSAGRGNGQQAGLMMNGTQILCKNFDGSLSWYTIDSTRSTPGNPVLLKV